MKMGRFVTKLPVHARTVSDVNNATEVLTAKVSIPLFDH